MVVLDAESAFDKNPKPLPDKSSEEIRNRRDIPKHDKGNLLYQPKREETQRISTKIGNKTRFSTPSIPISYST